MTSTRHRVVAILCSLTLLAGCVGDGLWKGPDNGPIPRGTELLFSPAPHAFRRATAPEPVRRGERSERFELRNGDCGGSDCGNPRYRAELRNVSDDARIGQDIWYGWSFLNQNVPSFSEDSALRNVFGQWKVSGDARAAIRLIQMGRGAGNWRGCDPTVCRQTNDTASDLVIQLDDMANAKGWGDRQNDGHICRLFSLEQTKGRWMDIVLNTNFGAGPDGYLNVWVNGEQKCAYRGQIVATADPGLKAVPNFRHGIFASYTERWDSTRGAAPKPTMVVYYDEILSGRTRGDVDTRLREMSGLPPKD
ncbi:heparin lyase I family protein [Oceaniglobus roseus]|uniref:heparin lyase I family protein n=1 Tax=Oceaniglobus roseus TaxID=1737570 RepID=UPI000C7EADC0|nr:heparin lyase I family protein [Kandeliimicrobium roseum]